MTEYTAPAPQTTLVEIESRLQRALNAHPMNTDLLWATLADVRRSLKVHGEAATTPTVEQSGEKRWEVWARHIAPLVHDGLIDTPQEREIPDKAFAIARLLDEHLPTVEQSGPLDVDALAEAMHPHGEPTIFLCCMGSSLSHLPEEQREPEHRRYHRESAEQVARNYARLVPQPARPAEDDSADIDLMDGTGRSMKVRSEPARPAPDTTVCDCGHTAYDHTDRGDQDAGLCLATGCHCPEFVETEAEPARPADTALRAALVAKIANALASRDNPEGWTISNAITREAESIVDEVLVDEAEQVSEQDHENG